MRGSHPAPRARLLARGQCRRGVHGLIAAVVLATGWAAALLWYVGPSGIPASAATVPSSGFPALGKPLNIVADEITVDSAGSGLVARGHVQLQSGGQRVTADVMRLNRAARTAELSGHVTVTDPRGRVSGDAITLYLTPDNQVAKVVVTGNAAAESREYSLSADQIVADRLAGRLLAQGHVNAFSAPDLIITGERATYDQHAQYGVISGHPAVANKAGRLRGDWIELFRAGNRAVVHGSVETEVYGATITGANAVMDFAKSSAVFTGDVVVTRSQGTLWADRVTVYYQTRRILAEGKTRATFNDIGEDVSP
jgi:lipopolysaccharide assembly outer membrane protein LptD (OstA)